MARRQIDFSDEEDEGGDGERDKEEGTYEEEVNLRNPYNIPKPLDDKEEMAELTASLVVKAFRKPSAERGG